MFLRGLIVAHTKQQRIRRGGMPCLYRRNIVSAQTIETYLNNDLLPYPFCPGCGHGTILNTLNTAMVQLQLDAHEVVVVSDIGCQGLSDKFYTTNAFHGLHGRSVTYATGIKMSNPDLKPIVLIGDGGCGIGGHHLLNAARRNIGMTVLVFNNFNYGMTGGEHSATTPEGALTTTTQYGQLERPLDICGTVQVNGAGFVARKTAFDKDLPDVIAEAIAYDGFSLIDIWELCTAYYVPNNRFSRKSLLEMLETYNFPTGIIHREDRPEYSRAYRAATSDMSGQPTMAGRGWEQSHQSSIKTAKRCVIAGAAGKKIGSAATAFCRGAILSGLWTTQRNDYPVTVKTGHSVAEIIVSPEEIYYTGITTPDVMVVVFPEGLKKEQGRIAQLPPEATLYINKELLPVETNATIVPLDFKATRQKQETWAMMALATVLRESGMYPLAAFEEAVSAVKRFAEGNLAAIKASEGLVTG
jgi:2-oxoglutarate/2-oxoacid ferredoxin oxidoreductase subunit beta